MTHDPLKSELGARIKHARQKQNYSQKQLAHLLCRRQAYISEIETGKTEPTVTLLLQLSAILQQPLQYFIPPGYLVDTPRTLDELSSHESQLITKLRQLPPGFFFHLTLRLLNEIVDFTNSYRAALLPPRPEETNHER